MCSSNAFLCCCLSCCILFLLHHKINRLRNISRYEWERFFTSANQKHEITTSRDSQKKTNQSILYMQYVIVLVYACWIRHWPWLLSLRVGLLMSLLAAANSIWSHEFETVLVVVIYCLFMLACCGCFSFFLELRKSKCGCERVLAYVRYHTLSHEL